jgi:hypothetical protein
MTLVELFAQHGRSKYLTDKGDAHSYFEVYDELFKPFQDKECNFFECGIQSGGDLKLFDDYFSKAKIMGIDIEENYVNSAPVNNQYSERVRVIKQDMREVDWRFFSYYKFPPDIAIDDGTHYLEDQIYFARTMYPIVRPGGFVIIEDVIDIQNRKLEFEKLRHPFEVIDMSHLRPLNDNVLIIFRK